MIYLDELIASHRKILRAGQLIGDAKGGAMAALGLFVAAIGYARSHLTDGVVPDEFLANAAKNRTAITALREVRLIAPVRGKRWRINDYFSYNPTAAEVEQKRKLTRKRVAKFRAARTGEGSGSNGVTGSLPPGTVTHSSRVPTIHDPRSSTKIHDPDPPTPGASTVRSASPLIDVPKREQRPDGRGSSSGIHLTERQKSDLAHAPAADENYAVLVRRIHSVMDAEGEGDPTSPDLIEAVKCAIAKDGIEYPPDVFHRALRSVATQRVTGRAPIQRGPLAVLSDVVRASLATNTAPTVFQELSRRRRR